MSRTLRELAYEKQQAVTQEKDAYEAVLERVRTDISRDHAETLARSIAEKSASEAVKRLIGEYVTAHQLRAGGMSAQVLADRLYGDMAGFGFLDKYIADPDIEEINGNSWRDIEIVTRSGWHKAPERFLSPQHAEDTLRKMVRLGGLVLDGTSPIEQVLEDVGAISLTAEEHAALVEHMNLAIELDNLERLHIYFRGHTDCFSYLKRIGAI